MMRPEDVQATRFRETWRGYDEDEVDDFMSRVAHALQVVATERDEAVARAERLASESESVTENERLLQRMLLTAERTAEETVRKAQTEAEQIRADARADAERIRIEAHEQARRELEQSSEIAASVRSSVEEFRGFRREYAEGVRAVISEQLAALERVGNLPLLPDRVAEFEQLDVAVPPKDAAAGADAAADSVLAGDGEHAGEDTDGGPAASVLDDGPASEPPDPSETESQGDPGRWP